ncbi:MAG: hypothetical protein MZV65_18990 [Chromatiales bacterium]|nr:hypothetical protein [Chromatiales bacterium]
MPSLKKGELLWWRDDTHWNRAGIAVAARVVAADLSHRAAGAELPGAVGRRRARPGRRLFVEVFRPALVELRLRALPGRVADRGADLLVHAADGRARSVRAPDADRLRAAPAWRCRWPVATPPRNRSRCLRITAAISPGRVGSYFASTASAACELLISWHPAS